MLAEYQERPSAPPLEVIESDDDLSIEQILALPYSEAKRQLIDKNLHKLLDIYSTTTKQQYVIINSENKYNVLKNICMNDKPKEILEQMRTIFGKVPMIKAKYADKLLHEVVTSKPENVRYKYIHVIGPYIMDPWNCTFSHSVFLCYYKDGNELTRCPLTMNRIFDACTHENRFLG